MALLRKFLVPFLKNIELSGPYNNCSLALSPFAPTVPINLCPA